MSKEQVRDELHHTIWQIATNLIIVDLKGGLL